MQGWVVGCGMTGQGEVGPRMFLARPCVWQQDIPGWHRVGGGSPVTSSPGFWLLGGSLNASLLLSQPRSTPEGTES